jgi:SpoVK/Ycf46/Vps4 family AAA+-type ATPase
MQSGRSITDIKKEEIPPIAKSHFEKALSRVRASVQQSELEEYEKWNAQFGSSSSLSA